MWYNGFWYNNKKETDITRNHQLNKVKKGIWYNGKCCNKGNWYNGNSYNGNCCNITKNQESAKLNSAKLEPA